MKKIYILSTAIITLALSAITISCSQITDEKSNQNQEEVILSESSRYAKRNNVMGQ